MTTPTLLTLRQFAEKHPAFSEGALRWHVFRAADNGLERHRAIKRLGRRVYIDEAAFFAWMDWQQPGATYGNG
jgi:hypothetical protein